VPADEIQAAGRGLSLEGAVSLVQVPRAVKGQARSTDVGAGRYADAVRKKRGNGRRCPVPSLSPLSGRRQTSTAASTIPRLRCSNSRANSTIRA